MLTARIRVELSLDIAIIALHPAFVTSLRAARVRIEALLPVGYVQSAAQRCRGLILLCASQPEHHTGGMGLVDRDCDLISAACLRATRTGASAKTGRMSHAVEQGEFVHVVCRAQASGACSICIETYAYAHAHW